MTDLDGLVSECRYLLLDFDGPITAVFSGISNRFAAKVLATVIDSPMPVEVATTDDPFDVLQFAASLDPGTAATVENWFTEIEVEAVRTSRPTPYTAEMIQTVWNLLDGLGVVSNNSVDGVDAYLTAHDLRQYVGGRRRGIYARTSANVSLLKPSPYLLHQAMDDLGATPDECLFVGDSVTDIQAAAAAGVPVVAFANRPEKIERLTEHSPAAVVTSMNELYSAFLELL